MLVCSKRHFEINWTVLSPDWVNVVYSTHRVITLIQGRINDALGTGYLGIANFQQSEKHKDVGSWAF